MPIKPLHTADDIKKLGTILSFWAHPDDETFTCAGIMAIAVKNGQKVICVTATRGEEGVQDETRWPKSKLAEIRTHELKAALKVVGISEHLFLKYRDGTLDKVALDEGAQHVRSLIRKYRPDSILTFGLDGLTGHPDHQAVATWARTASKNQVPLYQVVEEQASFEHLSKADKQFNWYFNIPEPPLKPFAECDIAFRLTPELRERKLRALKAMPSQYEKFFSSVPANVLQHLFTVECFVKA